MNAQRFYPLSTVQPYPFEQWWVAARSTELGRALLARTFLDQPVVMYRTSSGEAVALAGLCPHRLFPLAKGRLVGDALECGYHGFRYDGTGRCVHIPTQPEVKGRMGVRSFPLRERGGLAWIWMGDPERAEATPLPAIESTGVGAAGWATEYHPLATVRARYTLLIENLMDLSHISYIHADTIPGGEAVAGLPYEIEEGEASLNLRRVARGMSPNPYLRLLFPDNDEPIDQRFDAEYLGPGLIRTGGLIEAVAAGAARRALGTTNFVHAITPETPGSVHYFVQTSRDFRIDDAQLAGMNLAAGQKIQPQDVEAIELIELNASRHGDTRREISCGADAGGLRVRRRLSAQIACEAPAGLPSGP